MSRMYVCICNAITERQVRECAAKGSCSVDELGSELGLGSGCGRCRECASELLQEIGRDLKAPLLAYGG